MFPRVFSLFALLISTASPGLAQQTERPFKKGDIVTVHLMGDAGRSFMKLIDSRTDGQEEVDFYLPLTANCTNVFGGGVVLEGKFIRYRPSIAGASQSGDPPSASLKERRMITFTVSVPWDRIQTEKLPIPNFYHEKDLVRYKEAMKDKPRPKFVEIRDVKLQAWDLAREVDVGSVDAGN
jgi:hypothetical protein